jgi:hypothetical protein
MNAPEISNVAPGLFLSSLSWLLALLFGCLAMSTLSHSETMVNRLLTRLSSFCLSIIRFSWKDRASSCMRFTRVFSWILCRPGDQCAKDDALETH